MTITRADLPGDALEAYRQVDERLAAHEADRRHLIGLRDQVLRELVAREGWGGQTRAADALGVSLPQVHRLLADGVLRAVRDAIAGGEDLDLTEWSIVACRGGKAAVQWIGAATGLNTLDEITRLTVAGWLLDQWQRVGLPVSPAPGVVEGVRDALANGEAVHVGPAVTR